MARNSESSSKFPDLDLSSVKSRLLQIFDPGKISRLLPDLDQTITDLIEGYERRADRAEVVLNSLIDQVLNFDENNSGTSSESGRTEARSSGNRRTEDSSSGNRRTEDSSSGNRRTEASSSGNGRTEEREEDGFVFVQSQPNPMGCGSSYGGRSQGSPDSQSDTANIDAMLCDMCQTKFSIINRKKSCCECGVYFCGSCLPREGSIKTRTCSRCRVLDRKPPQRAELMKLRVKDLQSYLSRKKINIKSCVEKKDLVELVLLNSDSNTADTDSRPNIRISRSWDDSSIRVSDQVPIERPSDFPKSYIESSHRREWLERFDNAASEDGSTGTLGEEVRRKPEEEEDEVEDAADVENENPAAKEQQPSCDPTRSEVTETPVERLEDEEDVNHVTTLVSDFTDQPDDEPKEENDSISQSQDSDSPTTDTRQGSDSEFSSSGQGEEGAVGGTGAPGEGAGGSDQEKKVERRATLIVRQISEKGVQSLPSSPRRFANQGVVYLSEIKSVDDLKELSAKQAKEILAMNRVNFKGCVEKEELLKIVERLWKQEMKDKDMLEKMEDDSLCKICMDAPIDCVMLECGHMCTCTNCGKQMAECPICRQYVIRVVRTFKA